MSQFVLPSSPAELTGPVKVWEQDVVIPTYLPLPPDRNPMFLDRRVYQGSSGRVYPLPFYDRISEHPTDRSWQAVHLENEYVRLMVLPQIGGRIHVGLDKTNGYDFFYRQNVIKPALVGLAGPWISGGVEFNWPQHHRPSTFMPVQIEIEHHDDGSATVWCSDHDPLTRMKGMHGLCLHPGKAVIELKARAYNRTQTVQTFLWWANVATRVHESYQSFFPPDVYCVADHARRSMTEYPLSRGSYYGVDYEKRASLGVPKQQTTGNFVPPASGGNTPVDYAANDLSFYANIPVPTSYMCIGSDEDFFGGYDHHQRAGLIHIANHHISPGKKQWTWGNHEFGYAWDRNLTDADTNGEYAPYIELMAGVYTDNQPDFSFLMPGETKTWSQYWYPIQKIGAAQHANLDAAVSLQTQDGQVRVGVSVSDNFPGATIALTGKGETIASSQFDLAPGSAWTEEFPLPKNASAEDLKLRVHDASGREVIAYTPRTRAKRETLPPATEPPMPEEIESADELYLTGLHLEQYRHVTRSPLLYWREALRRDPGDARSNNAVGLWHLRRGELSAAESHFRAAIERLTRRNANPYDGEPLYNLGLTLCQLDRYNEAYAAFYKATWNQPWQAAAYHALAEIDCQRGDWQAALDHLDRSLRVNVENLGTRNLRVLVLRRLGRHQEAESQLSTTRSLDPLDWWARHLAGEAIVCPTQISLDISLDYSRPGFYEAAIRLLEPINPEPGTTPLVGYYLAWLHERKGNHPAAFEAARVAEKSSSDYCFPARLEEIAILETAMQLNPKDARAPYYLGNLFYDRRRHLDAIALWERSAKLDPNFSIVWRNLGIAYFNVTHKTAKARAAYDNAFAINFCDARLLFERDQLWKRLGKKPAKRLRELEKYPQLVAQRDDLSVELCALFNQSGRHCEAIALINSRVFQPWEGGEGLALGQYVRTHLALGREALTQDNPAMAKEHFAQALVAPKNLAEAKHLFANQSDIHYWMGIVCEALGDRAAAKKHWKTSAESQCDFQEMSLRAYSEMTYFSAMSLKRLKKKSAAKKLLKKLLSYARSLYEAPGQIDYFATSLPTMLLFEDDLQFRQQTTALFLEAQAQLGLGRKKKAHSLLRSVLKRDPNHPLARDFLDSQK